MANPGRNKLAARVIVTAVTILAGSGIWVFMANSSPASTDSDRNTAITVPTTESSPLFGENDDFLSPDPAITTRGH